ncbi:MAG: site-2 protease family protein [Deltaproteobacteria bacterium]|nr:site-2 protease family protein [Deltaproteobacteria bacterium]
MTAGPDAAPSTAEAPAPPEQPRRWGTPLLLFALTVVTTTLAGVGLARELPATVFFYQPLLTVLREPGALLGGLTFSLPLLLIFFTHEMGHFLVARHYGVAASLPYFIPLPAGLGTLGAVIAMREPSRSRGAILDIGAAGPLVGFAVAFVVLLVGFGLSEVKSAEDIALIADTVGVVVEGDSVAYALARWLVYGTLPPGADVWIHPTAYAGWFGMYLTWLNLQPFSQFDGGHIAFAVAGRHARAISLSVFGYLALLFGLTQNLLWISLLVVMLAMTGLIGLSHPPAIEDRPLTPRQKLTAFVCALVFLGTFVPNPWHELDPAELSLAPAVEVTR